MTWRDWNRSHCRACGKVREQGERFSARGKCVDCGEGRMIANARQLKAHDGEFFHDWRRAVIASVGGILPADQSTDPTRRSTDADRA